jgi:hypothetical protein
MITPTLRAAICTGIFFGLLFSIVLISINQLNLVLPEGSLAVFWLSLSWVSLLAGAIWGAFLWFDRHYREVPGRFLYHLFTGLALTFTAALLTSLWSYASVTILPVLLEQLGRILFPGSISPFPATSHPGMPAGKYALSIYSLVFFISFVQTLFLSTISCIRECMKA